MLPLGPPVPGLDASFAVVLHRDAARRRHITQALAREQVAAEVFPAVDGRDLTAAGLAELRRRGYLAPGLERERSRGQIACALSHVRLLERIVEHGYRHTLVLEDDAKLVAGFRRQLADRLREAPPDFDLLYLYCCSHPSMIWLEVEGLAHLRRPVYPIGTVGYVVSLRGAERALRLVKPIYYTIDNMLAEHVEEGRLTAYITVPALVSESEGFLSNIRGSGFVPSLREEASDWGALPEPAP
jgi:glycosyl transferase, family 25